MADVPETAEPIAVNHVWDLLAWVVAENLVSMTAHLTVQ